MVGGIHGDEVAGWMAANKIRDEELFNIKCGTLYVLSPANESGAEAVQRYVVGSGDMNRVFPGSTKSSDRATKIAGAIFEDVKRVNPDFALDLHEARVEPGEESEYGCANTLIYSMDNEMAELIFELVIANEDGDIWPTDTFVPFYPGKPGSFNRILGDNLGIPCLTTETWRKHEVEFRVQQQIDVVEFCLKHYGML